MLFLLFLVLVTLMACLCIHIFDLKHYWSVYYRLYLFQFRCFNSPFWGSFILKCPTLLGTIISKMVAIRKALISEAF